MAICKDIIKTREIDFRSEHAASNPAQQAMALLKEVRGIEHMQARSNHRLQLRYDVRRLTLQMVENALTEVGFNLHNGLIHRMQRALLSYCEDTQRASLGVNREAQTDDNISLPKPQTQDPRPDHWRHYTS